MRKLNICLIVAVAVAVLAFASGPTLATWNWTSSSPLVFEFNDYAGQTFVNPATNEAWPKSTWPYMVSSNDPTIKFNDFGQQCVPQTPKEMWHSFTGNSLKIQRQQSSGFCANYTSFLRCDSDVENTYFNFTNQFSYDTLDLTNGLVIEVVSKSWGSPDINPSGYTWSGNTIRGGVFYNMRGTKNIGFNLVWVTGSATNPNDDFIGGFSAGQSQYFSVPYSLGGDPDNPPHHTYKIWVRKSPVLPDSAAGSQLLNVWVGDPDGSNMVRVIRNRNFQAGSSIWWNDSITLGSIQKSTNGSFGEEYDRLKLYEADAIVDSNPPTSPTGLSAIATSTSSVCLTWNPATDAETEVVGYRIYRDGNHSFSADELVTLYNDTSVAPGTTYTYEVRAVDAAGNLSASGIATAIVSTPLPYTGSTLTFDFNDPAATYTATSNPNYFSSDATETNLYWFGQKGVCSAAGVAWATNDSQLNLDKNKYQWKFSGNGSLTCQTVGGWNSGYNQHTMVDTNNLQPFWKWVYDDGYIRGIKISADISLVGDAEGWCAPWPSDGSLYPFVPPCTDSSLDLLHQGSDWGSSHAGHRSWIAFNLDKNLNLDEPSHPGKGNTGDGAMAWIGLTLGSGLYNRAGDNIVLSNFAGSQYASFTFKDGKGFGLTAENGDPDTGNGEPRDGVIQGNTNRVKIEIGVCKAPDWPTSPGINDDEYWDIWITRPDGTRIHIDSMTANANISDPNMFVFSPPDSMHTLWGTTGDKVDPTKVIIGDWGKVASVFGLQYNQIVIRNDWDGDPEPGIKVANLATLYSLPIGSVVNLSSYGGEKIVTSIAQSEDFFSPPFFFYVEQEDRSSGIRIVNNMTIPAASKGEQISCLGFLRVDDNGNRYVDITDGKCSFSPATKTIDPVGMNNLTVGGSEVTDGVGLRNVSLLATVWGKVLDKDQDWMGNVWFVLDDGSGTTVKCYDYISDGVTLSPNLNEYWSVTGVIALEKVGSDYKRTILVDTGLKHN